MPARTFRGRFDLARMGLADIAALSDALAKIEAMADRGVVEFAVSASRPKRSDAGIRRTVGKPAMQKQMADVLSALDEERWSTVAEVAELSGANANSVGVRLRALAVSGLAERATRPLENWSGGRRTNVVYRRATSLPSGSREANAPLTPPDDA